MKRARKGLEKYKIRVFKIGSHLVSLLAATSVEMMALIWQVEPMPYIQKEVHIESPMHGAPSPKLTPPHPEQKNNEHRHKGGQLYGFEQLNG